MPRNSEFPKQPVPLEMEQQPPLDAGQEKTVWTGSFERRPIVYKVFRERVASNERKINRAKRTKEEIRAWQYIDRWCPSL